MRPVISTYQQNLLNFKVNCQKMYFLFCQRGYAHGYGCDYGYGNGLRNSHWWLNYEELVRWFTEAQ